MDKKLTLSVDKNVIEKAKIYAKLNETSLSNLVEEYLSTLTNIVKSKEQITPLVESLSGVIDVSCHFDEKEDYTDFLMKKYK